ncbi:MAG TPA: hypothetical protein VFB59_05150 [Candidatus Saccharimonadales bacterium]|nr:hypothetical protein [Candidatus Saccharimonadales bacterium]
MAEHQLNPFIGLKNRLAAKAAIACTAVAAMILAQPLSEDLSRESTVQEAQIANGIEAAFGQARIVRCVSSEQLARRSNPLVAARADHVGGVAWPGLPFIWLNQKECDAISLFIAYPPQKSYEIRSGQARALFNAVHEYRHTVGTLQEDRANCEALQTMGELGETLGAPAELKKDITQFAALGFEALVNKYEKTGQSEIIAPYKLDNCLAGSSYDLGILPAANFPWPLR